MPDELSDFDLGLPPGTPRFSLVDFSVPIAQRLSDLTGIDADLDAVEKVCVRLKEMNVQGSDVVADGLAYLDNLAFGDILFDAAVIKFGRIQATGARTCLPSDWIADLPSHLRDIYRHVIDLRNRFIAHPVAPLEDNQVYVSVQIDEGKAVGVGDVTVTTGKVFRGSANDAVCLHQLATVLRARLQLEIESEKAKVLDAARAMPLDELVRRGYEEFAIPSTRDVKKVRKKFSFE